MQLAVQAVCAKPVGSVCAGDVHQCVQDVSIRRLTAATGNMDIMTANQCASVHHDQYSTVYTPVINK